MAQFNDSRTSERENERPHDGKNETQVRHSHGTLVMRSLLAGEYNLTLEAFNSFGSADRSPIVCPFRVPAEGEVVNHTQVRATVGWLVGRVVGRFCIW